MRRLAISTFFVSMVSILVVPMAVAQVKPTASKPSIKIGAIYDFAGPCHMYSGSAINGIKIALDEINAKGGILGRKLER